MNGRAASVGFVIGLLLYPTLAQAQFVSGTPYRMWRAPVVYTELTNPIVIWDTEDDAQNDVAIPFDFTFYDQLHTVVSVNTNGGIVFSSGFLLQFSNQPPGSSPAADAFIAPFWDDLRLNGAPAQIGYQIQGLTPDRTITIEYRDVSLYATPNSFINFQIRLFEGASGRIEVDYGPGSGSTNFSGTMGMEDQAGGRPILFTPDQCTNTCDLSNLSSLFDTRVVLKQGVPVDPELTAVISGFPRGAFPGDSAAGTVDLFNYGTSTASAVVSGLWLSTDRVLDVSDTLVGGVTATVATGTTSTPVSIDVPQNHPIGVYYVLLEVDAAHDFQEENEFDNVVASTAGFATGYELRPTRVELISPSVGVGAGQTATFAVDLSNEGVPRVGDIEVALYVSLDGLFDAGDTPLGIFVTTLLGQVAETATITATMPQVPAGSYYPIVLLDPGDQFAEVDELNNALVGTNVFPSGSDFTIGDVSANGGVAPGGQATVTTEIVSAALPHTGIVNYRLWASADASLDASDFELGTYAVTFNQESLITDPRSANFPSSMLPGAYFLIGEADPAGLISEVDETNNVAVSGQIVVGYDFRVGNISASPTTLEAGDAVTVTGTITSFGPSFTGSVDYRVFLSSDNVFDPGDASVHSGSAQLSGAATASFAATFPLFSVPPVPPGTYKVIVVADPDDLVAEALEDNNWGGGNQITIVGADLLVVSITAPNVGFSSMPVRVEVEIANAGVASARAFRYAYYLSDNDIIRVTDQRIFLSDTATIGSGGQQSFSDLVTLPTYTSSQTKWLGVIVDIFSRVPESSETNNIRRARDPIWIISPVPDLTASFIQVPTQGAAGEQIAVTRLLQNQGVADASAFDYVYYLSANPTISFDDIPVGQFTGPALAVHEDDLGIDILTIPPNVPPSDYYLGLLVDPDDLLKEVDEDNNTAVSADSLVMHEPAIRILTDTLPNATLAVPYEVGVYATGGAVPLSWTIHSGALPDGLTLNATTGIISGTPTTEGLFELTIRAVSGPAFAEGAFGIRVSEPTVELGIVTPSLPSALVGRAYQATIIAAGGTEPYEWSVISQLPPGLSLDSSGRLSGTPNTQGSLPITVRVRDDIGNSASKELILHVITANQSVAIAQIPLPTAVVDTPFCDAEKIAFEARNGVPPYSWSILGNPPPGMTLLANGEFCGTPELARTYQLVIRAQDQTGLFDTSLFLFEVDDGTTLAITSFTLEDGMVGTHYEAQLSAIQGEQPYRWKVIEEWSSPPPGLTLDEDGVLSGSPTTAGVFVFVAHLTDAQLRTDVQPLTLEVLAAPVTPDDEGCGCSSTRKRQSSLWSLLGLSILYLIARRRRKRLLPVLSFLLVSGSATAQAQLVPGTPYQMSTRPNLYTELANPTVLWTSVDNAYSNVSLPFDFLFYDATANEISVGSNGAIALNSGTYFSLANQPPGTSSAHNFLAPFWDDLRLDASAGGHIAHETEGVAPNRTFTVEFKNIGRWPASSVALSFQVRLFEGPSARIELDFGPASGSGAFSATMGMEDANGNRPILFHQSGCTTNCTQANFESLTNHRITLVQDPGIELIAQSIEGPDLAFLGAETPIEVTLSNLHGVGLGPFTIRTVLSPTPDLLNATPAGSLQVFLSPFQTSTAIIPSIPPPIIGEGEFYWGAIVDSADVIPEVNESNNTVSDPVPVRLLAGKPDLSIDSVSMDSTEVDAGGTITVYAQIHNVGGEPAPTTEVALVLSSNPVISPQDFELDRFSISLQPGEVRSTTTTLTLPLETNSGAYRLGVLADPDSTLDELDESNNGRASAETLVVVADNVAITTQALPNARARTAYVALLTAVGGDSNHQWEVAQGRLPQGLGLVSATGEIYGRPTVVETQNFTVRVTSAGETDETEFTIRVVDPAQPLTIVSRSAPPAIVGQEYTFLLVATGGATSTSSVTWSATGLPDGLDIETDGTISGTPNEPGTSTAAISIFDGAEAAHREISIEVREHANLLIDTRPLSDATFGEGYSEQLLQTGGIPPITWVIQRGRLPDGIELSPSGLLSGVPTLVGSFPFVVEARDSDPGGITAKDVNTFTLTVLDVDGFVIATTSLPDAFVGRGYDEVVTTTGGIAPMTWIIDKGLLPKGIVAKTNEETGVLRIAGQPEATGFANLLLEVIDSQGRRAHRGMVLRVLEPPADPDVEESGCGCQAARTRQRLRDLALLFGLIGLAVWRRLRTSKS